jgi:hypothetical protein
VRAQCHASADARASGQAIVMISVSALLAELLVLCKTWGSIAKGRFVDLTGLADRPVRSDILAWICMSSFPEASGERVRHNSCVRRGESECAVQNVACNEADILRVIYFRHT